MFVDKQMMIFLYLAHKYSIFNNNKGLCGENNKQSVYVVFYGNGISFY